MELRDGQIVLRPWREDDAEVVYLACQDPETQRRLPALPQPYTKDDAHAFVTGAIGRGPHHFAITEEEVVVLGSVGLSIVTDTTGDVGYWCIPGFRRRGITTRAARRVCRFAFDGLRLERLTLRTDFDNVASQRVAEKLGFRREAEPDSGRPEGADPAVFSLRPGELH